MLEEIQAVYDELSSSNTKSISHFEYELQKVRAGKATPSMLQSVLVDYYGTPTLISQVANIGTMDARTITVQPWEKSMLPEIAKGIINSNLGFAPQNNGESILINVPPLTEERRKELVKKAKAEGETAKVAVRNNRKDAIDMIKLLKADGLSEDSVKDAEAEVQNVTNAFIKKVDEIVELKEKDILTIWFSPKDFLMDFNIDQIELHSSTIYLLEYDDYFDTSLYLDTLTVKEKERFFSFKSEKRKREFLATRILKHQLFSYQEIKYEEHGAPYFDSKTFISISHGKNIVGIAVNENFQIGFDLEQIRDKAQKIFSKFLNNPEKEIFDTSDITEMTATWSFKESLYKLAGRKMIDFKKELLLLKKNKNFVEAKIINPKEEILAELAFVEYKGNVITINTKAVEYKPK